ncbi:MAG: membrane protein insertase YidC [Parvularculaceae bacterium]|nr:membrane protein insertase YidC [Parvularculaceae bacterium]
MDRNFVLALGLALLIFVGWDFAVLRPQQKALEEAQRVAAEAAAAAEPEDFTPDTQLDVPNVTEAMSREEALKEGPGRITIDTPTMKGSLNLRGATLDDIALKGYRTTVKDDAPMVTVLSPRSSADATFIRNGIIINGESDDSAGWSAPEGATLTPETPVTLTRQQGGIQHQLTISVDDQFMFSTEHKVMNAGDEEAKLLPYGYTMQRGVPDDLSNFMILFEGPLGVTGGKQYSRKYKKLDKNASNAIEEQGVGGWAGITEKYWFAAAIPPQDENFKLDIEKVKGSRKPTYRSSYQLDGLVLEPGQQVTINSNMFAGAKVVETLRTYEKDLGITNFDKAVDWGMFFLLTRPIQSGLHFFGELTGNYGVAILLLTLVIKALLFPLANASYVSMAGMRKVGPEMKRIQERYKDDRMKQQQEVMALYKKHKINPAAGCLPVLLQMPIFFALYKVLFTTIEIRHEGFLYIPDLSEQDPTTIFNLFGLIPFDPTTIPMIGAFLGLGVLPLLMGAAMFVQTKLNPPPTDPVQAQVFGFLPLIFMFIFAPFAAGLVLYWFWNTFLGVVQQYFIMKRAGADVDLIANIKSTFTSSSPTGDQPANDK